MNIILDQPHTHAGKELPIGTPLTLSDRDAVWLIRQRIAHQDTDQPSATGAAVVSASVPAATTELTGDGSGKALPPIGKAPDEPKTANAAEPAERTGFIGRAIHEIERLISPTSDTQENQPGADRHEQH